VSYFQFWLSMKNRHTNLSTVLLALCAVPTFLWAGSVQLEKGKDQIDVIVSGRPFTTYYFDPQVSKPYLMPLRTASGLTISRPFPVINDISHADSKASSFEPHQRPLYFAHGDIDGLNFWAEQVFQPYYHAPSKQAYGAMRVEKVEQAGDGTVQATFALESPNKHVIGEETQRLTFGGDDHTRTIDCEFSIQATHGPITMGDTKEGTFAIRLGPELSAPNGRMINSNGGVGEPQIWGKPADWVDYSGSIAGHPVGIVVFDNPKSFRHPITWHARAYGLLAANPFGLREFAKDPQRDGSWTIPEGHSLEFRYRVVIYDGELSPESLNQMYREYASEP
jgi:hypothetical protein